MIDELPAPQPGPDEVLIRTRASALCGSELGAYRGNGMPSGNGGHEAVGIVESFGAREGVGTGQSTEHLRPGMRVGVSAIAGCGRPDCPQCARGESTWCPNRAFYGNMHAEYFVTKPSACLPLPDDVPDDIGVLITGDGLGVPYHTGLKIAGPEFARIAVFGLGPVGLGNVLLQSYYGRTVIGIDPSAERRRIATVLGAAHTIDPADDDPVQAVNDLTGGGTDAAIEAAGVPQTVSQCFACVRTAGTVIFNGEQPEVTLSPSEDFIRRDIRAIGSWFYHVGEHPAMLGLYRQELNIDGLVTHRYSLQKAPEAFELFSSARTGKVVLRYP